MSDIRGKSETFWLGSFSLFVSLIMFLVILRGIFWGVSGTSLLFYVNYFSSFIIFFFLGIYLILFYEEKKYYFVCNICGNVYESKKELEDEFKRKHSLEKVDYFVAEKE